MKTISCISIICLLVVNAFSQDTLLIYEFPATNNFELNVKNYVSKDNENLVYHYSVKNHLESAQSIAFFDVSTESMISSISSPENWFGLGNSKKSNRVSWGPLDVEYQIDPGDSLGNYNYNSYDLPSIKLFLSAAYVEQIDLNREPDSTSESSIFETSKLGYTVAPDSNIRNLNHNDYLDSLISFSQQSIIQNWITDELTTDKYINYFQNTKGFIQQNNISEALNILNTVLQDVQQDSGVALTSEAYALLFFNTEYLVEQLSSSFEPGFPIKLVNSQNQLLTGGSLQYYEGGWQDAINNGDGTFQVNTERTTVSLRMTYAYGSETKQNVAVGTDTVVFQTINTQVQLTNSSSQLIDEGTVKYYAGGWRDFGTTSGGIVSKELLPKSYSFRMTYAYASNDQSQDIGTNSTVIFQTTNAQVELRNSSGDLMPAPIGDEGTAKYYAGGWRDFGTTSGGIASKELLPKSYNFRMTYAFASNDQSQDIGSNPTIVFQTTNSQVELRNSNGDLIDEGTVKYYAGGWRDFGTTSGGIATQELLAKPYNFRMTFAFASNDKNQDISANPVVGFSTVLTTVNVKDQNNQSLDNAVVKYYSGGWRTIGNTNAGSISTELLPKSYSFRATFQGVSYDIKQDISADPVVNIQLVIQ
jgi:hypothetical protein